MKRTHFFNFFIAVISIAIAVLIHIKFTKYEWQHLMFKPNPLLYFIPYSVEHFQFSQTILKLNITQKIGIVYLIYPKSVLSCYTSIKFLRKAGKTHFPVELWYHSDESAMDIIGIFDNVVLKNIKDYNISVDVNLKNNYHFKSVAILHSSFEKVIYIDADALVVSDLNYVLNSFNTDIIGAKDFWFTPASNPIYSLLNATPIVPWDMEAGFLVVNKSSVDVRKSLQMAFEMNINHKIFYKYIWGDKDTFRLSFEYYNISIGWLDSPAVVTSKFYSIKGNSMAHYFGKEVMIIHMTLLKDDVKMNGNPFNFVWKEDIHGPTSLNYFNLGTIGHLIKPKCVMALNNEINNAFWKYRMEAAHKLQLLGYIVDYKTGDKFITLSK